MDVQIVNKSLDMDIYGFSGTALNQDYAGTAFTLMNTMWQTIKNHNLKNKGQNIWVYESNEKVFAGVELEALPEERTGLEHKHITLDRYAYYKHVGPYSLIKKSGQAMRDELESRGLMVGSIYIERYGHWTNDETKLETELLMAL